MALSKPLHSVLKEELECGICLDKLKNPRLLTCHHSFCETCLDGCVNDSGTDGPNVECPVCRYTTTIPQAGVSGLRPDFRANKFLIALEEEQNRKVKMGSQGSKCSLCDATEAADFCVECDQNMCTVCSQIHKKMPVCRDHTLYPLHEVVTGKSRVFLPEASTSKCSKHDERVKFYCKTCHTPICAECNVLDHNKADGHDCVYLKEVMPQLRRDLQELVVKVRAKEGELQEFATDIDTTKQALAARCDLVDRRITEELAKIKDNVDIKSNSFKETTLGNLHGMREENESNQKAVDNVLTVLSQVNSSNDDVEVAGIYESLRESAQSVVSNQLNREVFYSVQLAVKTFDLMPYQISYRQPELKLVHATRPVTFLDIPDDTELSSMSLISHDEIVVTLKDREKISSKVIYHSRWGDRIPTFPPSPFPGNCQQPAHGTPAQHGRPVKPAKPVIPAANTNTAPHGIAGTIYKEETSYKPDTFGIRKLGIQYKLTTARKVLQIATGLSPELATMLHNGQICYVLGGQLCRDDKRMTNYYFPQSYCDISHDSSNNIFCVVRETFIPDLANTVHMISAHDTSKSHSILTHYHDNISPNRVAACRDSPESILVAQLQPATVLRISKSGEVLCSIKESDSSSWEKVAIASDASDNVYILSSVNSNCSLRVFNKGGRLLENVLTRPEPSSTTTADNPPPKGESLGSRLSVAVLPDGSVIAAYIGGQKILVITRVEKDVEPQKN